MPVEVQNWDQSQGNWDSGLQWDVNVPNVGGDVTPYLDLVTSEHRDKLNFIDALTAILQPMADLLVTMGSMPGLFDVDVAVGDQLDKTGLWIGPTRFVSVPLSGVYFSLGPAGPGFGIGIWKGPNDPTSGLLALPDDIYRKLLFATIAANRWDGSIPQAYEIWAIVFASTGESLIIIDGGDMTMKLGIAGPVPDIVTRELFLSGLLQLKPAGVRITEYLLPTVDGPLFGFGAETATIAGFGHGGWAEVVVN